MDLNTLQLNWPQRVLLKNRTGRIMIDIRPSGQQCVHFTRLRLLVLAGRHGVGTIDHVVVVIVVVQQQSGRGFVRLEGTDGRLGPPFVHPAVPFIVAIGHSFLGHAVL